MQIGWLPGFVNAESTVLGTRMVENLPRIRKDPKPFLLGAFGTLPQVLFLLMPLFALLLKIFYIFKRRLYMEHVMVALHSHAFIFLTLLLITIFGLTRNWTDTAAPWLSPALGWVIFALGWWLPLYLLIMQKRVYRQGWFLHDRQVPDDRCVLYDPDLDQRWRRVSDQPGDDLVRTHSSRRQERRHEEHEGPRRTRRKAIRCIAVLRVLRGSIFSLGSALAAGTPAQPRVSGDPVVR